MILKTKTRNSIKSTINSAEIEESKQVIFLCITVNNLQKLLSRAVPRKRCSENTQQIYRRAPMRKCIFNKVALVSLLKWHFAIGVLQ